ncbi:MAG: oligogalacturonide lyase [Ruminococcaceae bacterium]|nr:oligogalacturonide lyase [Oscillospiraceae bacterium]
MQKYASEKVTYADPNTGAEITRLTGWRANSNHLYFTNNSFYDGGQRIVFESDRGNAVNLFSLELASGEIEQLTDLPPQPYPKDYGLHVAFVDGANAVCVFFVDRVLYRLDIRTKSLEPLYEMPEGYGNHILSVTADGGHVLTSIHERPQLKPGKDPFRQMFEAHPHSMILRIPMAGGAAQVIWEEDTMLAHVNASPVDPDLFTFCHEGPWALVDHRLWLGRISTGKIIKLHPCEAGENIGHEYWFADGQWIGYHGIKGDRKQLGRVSPDGKTDLAYAFPFQTGHIFSRDEHLVVGDGTRDGKYLRLWRLIGDGYEQPRALCAHNCSCKRQRAHVHPALTPDGKSVLYTSDETGYEQVYLVRIPEDLTELPMLDTLSKL